MSYETVEIEPPYYNEEREMSTFTREISAAINRASKENGSDTPDFILAEYLSNCLTAFDKAARARERWYDRAKKQGATTHAND